METVVQIAEKYVWGFPEKLPWLVVVLLSAGLFITLRLAFIQLRQVGHAIRVVMGRYDDPNDPGDVSHFQALSTALSATVGIGNIAGVALAIHYGGPGAVFWMWVTAGFGMALKYAECTLSTHYRKFDDKGDVAGGPMYYIELGLGKSWKPLAMIFAGCAIVSSFGGGNMNQANTVATSAASEFGMDGWMVGAGLVVIVGAVILGGIRSIARVASTLAPSMAAIYVSTALVILILNAGDVPGALATIVTEAFNPKAGLGGTAAGALSVTLLWGVKRGLFSNEAGQGSAPIAHAAAKTDEPVREGAVAMLEPLIDTLIICTMTALVIVIAGVWDQKKPSQIGVDKVGVVLTATLDAEGGVQDAKAPDAPMDIQVTEGRQDALTFMEADGSVDNAALVVSPGGEPFTGALRFDPGAEGGGRFVAKGADGREVGLELKGEMLQLGSPLTAWAFDLGLAPIGDFGALIVTLCVFLFAVSTIISWSYYGDRCVTYLFGTRYVIVYRAVYIGFVYLGATTALETVWTFGDVALGLMTVPNLIAVLLLSPKIVQLSRDYFKRMKEESR